MIWTGWRYFHISLLAPLAAPVYTSMYYYWQHFGNTASHGRKCISHDFPWEMGFLPLVTKSCRIRWARGRKLHLSWKPCEMHIVLLHSPQELMYTGIVEFFGLVVVTPPPTRPPTRNRSRDRKKIISWAVKRLQNYCIEAVCMSVCLFVCLSIRNDFRVAWHCVATFVLALWCIYITKRSVRW